MHCNKLQFTTNSSQSFISPRFWCGIENNIFNLLLISIVAFFFFPSLSTLRPDLLSFSTSSLCHSRFPCRLHKQFIFVIRSLYSLLAFLLGLRSLLAIILVNFSGSIMIQISTFFIIGDTTIPTHCSHSNGIVLDKRFATRLSIGSLIMISLRILFDIHSIRWHNKPPLIMLMAFRLVVVSSFIGCHCPYRRKASSKIISTKPSKIEILR